MISQIWLIIHTKLTSWWRCVTSTCHIYELAAEAATDRQQSRKHQKNAAKYCFKHGVFLENKAAARADFQCVSHRLAGTLLASSDTFLCALFFPSASPLSPLPGCFTSHHLKGLHGRQHRSEFKRLNIVHWEVAEKQTSRGSLWRWWYLARFTPGTIFESTSSSSSRPFNPFYSFISELATVFLSRVATEKESGHIKQENGELSMKWR